MPAGSSREKILKRIRQAIIYQRPQPFPAIDWDKSVYADSGLSLEETFAKEFTTIGGHFIFCENKVDFFEQLIELSEQNQWKKIICVEEPLTRLLDEVEFPYQRLSPSSGKGNEGEAFPEGVVSITSCEALVARLGAVIVSSKTESGRRLTVVATTHVVVAYTEQLVPDLKEAFDGIRKKHAGQLPSYIASIAGPSRTADIEKTLVTPAHGPKDIFVFLIDSSQFTVHGSR